MHHPATTRSGAPAQLPTQLTSPRPLHPINSHRDHLPHATTTTTSSRSACNCGVHHVLGLFGTRRHPGGRMDSHSKGPALAIFDDSRVSAQLREKQTHPAPGELNDLKAWRRMAHHGHFAIGRYFSVENRCVNPRRFSAPQLSRITHSPCRP